MSETLFWIVIFVVSLFVLIKASGYFTDSAEKIGLFFGLPAFIVGVTIVAIGTSLPELISSIIAVSRNSSEIVVGNVIGSNIANIFLVLGLVAIMSKKMKITYELINVDLPILIGSAFLFAIMIWDGVLSLPEAFLLIAGIVIYFFYAISSEKKHGGVYVKTEIKDELKSGKKLGAKTIIVLGVSALFIYIGARYTIESIIKLSEMLNIGKELIAVSAVALGTSLPELAVSITAVKKGKPELAVGNILGSNIFNTFVVMGVPGLFGVLIIPKSILHFSLPMMLIATVLFFLITLDKEITKWEGYLLLLFYVFFIGKLFGLF